MKIHFQLESPKYYTCQKCLTLMTRMLDEVFGADIELMMQRIQKIMRVI
jgi:hypothetical protein